MIDVSLFDGRLVVEFDDISFRRTSIEVELSRELSFDIDEGASSADPTFDFLSETSVKSRRT